MRKSEKPLFDLSHDDKIIAKKADKSSVVIMNRTDYIEEVERQLKNEKFYKHLNEDPSGNIDKDIIRTLNTIAQKEHMLGSHNFMCFPRYIRNMMQLFLLVILAACNSPTEHILGVVDKILQSHVKNLDS